MEEWSTMTFGFSPISAETRIFIAGHRGLVGSALHRHFSALGYQNLLCRTSDELDLRDARATEAFFRQTRPEVVIAAAARVGGIVANANWSAQFISENLRIQLNLIDSAVATGARRFLFLGSSCVYPRMAEQPIREEALLTGPLESTNEAYAVAKIAGISHIAAIRRQYQLPYITVMPPNLYGPGDNFDPVGSHVLPAMIRRLHDAARAGAPSVTCWGTGTPRREFMYADDLADACHFLLDNYDDDRPINAGAGRDITIAGLAGLVSETVGYRGEITWDVAMPDGTPRKMLDTSRLDDLGWRSKTPLAQGLQATYEWFLAHQDDYRGVSLADKSARGARG